DISRLLQGPPRGGPRTLVAAMINVAVRGLHAGVVADGLRLRAWAEPQLASLQAQLQQINLLPSLVESMHVERAASCHVCQVSRRAELADLFSFGVPHATFGQKIRNPENLLVSAIPRGWIYQNMAAVAVCNQN